MTELTKAELIVMRCIWELGDGASKIEIENQIESRFHKGWRPTTVSTFLSHLREKGYVDFTSIYTLALSFLLPPFFILNVLVLTC